MNSNVICSVSGGELFERVADADCLTEKEASFYMYQLLQGLQYMHMKNIVHLDLKVTKSSHSLQTINYILTILLLLQHPAKGGEGGASNGLCEHASTAFFFASTRIDESYPCEQRAFSKSTTTKNRACEHL